MKILTVLTYYRPHTSGLTIYAERLARAFVKRGHQVTVMTTQYDPSLPKEEIMEGVRVVRVPVLARVSKGVIAPTFGLMATRLVWQHDVVQLHLPQFDAPGVALRARLFGKPAVLTYHCDVQLPIGMFNWLVNLVLNIQNNLAGRFASHIVTYTEDYANNSPYLSRYRSKFSAILPPVELPAPRPGAVEAFFNRYHLAEQKPAIGMAARFATEKGVEVLLDALPIILKRYPRAQVLFAGTYQNVMGEQAYSDRLMPRIYKYEIQGNWVFLGNLDPQQMSEFYPNLDVLTVPSLNSTEAFGLVQIEAMMNGVPCVPSALPGVRRPVQMHGMGQVSEIGDAVSLAQAILEVLDHPEVYKGDIRALHETYEPDSIAHEYEKLFQRLMRK